MKIVVQNGCDHALSRNDVTELVKLIPTSWLSAIQEISLFQSDNEAFNTEFYVKRSSLYFFCPREFEGPKEKVVSELLISIVCIAENGDLPRKMTKSKREYYKRECGEILEAFVNIN